MPDEYEKRRYTLQVRKRVANAVYLMISCDFPWSTDCCDEDQPPQNYLKKSSVNSKYNSSLSITTCPLTV